MIPFASTLGAVFLWSRGGDKIFPSELTTAVSFYVFAVTGAMLLWIRSQVRIKEMSVLKSGIPKRRLSRLFLMALMIVCLFCAAHSFLRQPATFEIADVLWVKKEGVFHAPGSSVSRAVIDRLHPDYMDLEEMTFTGPVLLLYDNFADRETSNSRSPLILIPHAP